MLKTFQEVKNYNSKTKLGVSMKDANIETLQHGEQKNSEFAPLLVNLFFCFSVSQKRGTEKSSVLSVSPHLHHVSTLSASLFSVSLSLFFPPLLVVCVCDIWTCICMICEDWYIYSWRQQKNCKRWETLNSNYNLKFSISYLISSSFLLCAIFVGVSFDIVSKIE